MSANTGKWNSSCINTTTSFLWWYDILTVPQYKYGIPIVKCSLKLWICKWLNPWKIKSETNFQQSKNGTARAGVPRKIFGTVLIAISLKHTKKRILLEHVSFYKTAVNFSTIISINDNKDGIQLSSIEGQAKPISVKDTIKPGSRFVLGENSLFTTFTEKYILFYTYHMGDVVVDTS